VRLKCRPRGILQAKANGYCFKLLHRWRYFRTVSRDETVSPGRTQVLVVGGKYYQVSAGTCIQAQPIASTPVPRPILPRNSRPSPAFGLKTTMSESRSAASVCPLAEVSEIRGNVTQPKLIKSTTQPPPPLVDQNIISAWAVILQVNLSYKFPCSPTLSAHFLPYRTSKSSHCAWTLCLPAHQYSAIFSSNSISSLSIPKLRECPPNSPFSTPPA
jgi:hypothetical protein